MCMQNIYLNVSKGKQILKYDETDLVLGNKVLSTHYIS